MDTDEDAELCVRKLNGSDWQGRRLLVRGAGRLGGSGAA